MRNRTPFRTYTPGGRVEQGSIPVVTLDDENTYQCEINDVNVGGIVTREIELKVVGEFENQSSIVCVLLLLTA